jgi:hypothetical protein
MLTESKGRRHAANYLQIPAKDTYPERWFRALLMLLLAGYEIEHAAIRFAPCQLLLPRPAFEYLLVKRRCRPFR